MVPPKATWMPLATHGLGYILLVSEGQAAAGAMVSFGSELFLRAMERSMNLFY